MTTPADDARRRPGTVTALVVLTALVSAVNVVIAITAAIALIQPEPAVGLGEAVPRAWLTVGVLAAVGIAQAVIAVMLARGVNAARIFMTLAATLVVASILYDASESGNGVGTASLSAALSAIPLVLAWTPSSSRFFQNARERALADAVAATHPVGRRRLSTALEFVLQIAAVAITVALTPGVSADRWWVTLVAAVMVALAGSALRPLLVRIAGMFGWFGALFSALFANAAIVGAGLWITPGISVTSIGWAILASWIYAVVMTMLSWLFSVSTEDYLMLHATRLALGGEPPEVDDAEGVLMIQLDGVPAPVLEEGIRSGNLPTISRWIRSGSHTWIEWVARVPSTTPVSQAGILHGTNDGIPAFRWYDREAGRMIVANKPSDASFIEDRVSDGRGLLADDGVSISNLFSGDAPTSLLTMSGARSNDKGLGPSASYAAFFTHPAGFVRALVLTTGEMIKEVFQARRQVRRGVEPRVHRSGAYVALRGVTNVFLRDLNVALVVEAMMRGRKSIYVDFVDYDEIAHHAGVTRPESLASLYGLDGVLASLERLALSGVTPRKYNIVLVSDHGQSQGATFKQRYGISLEQFVSDHCSGVAMDAPDAESEAWGPVSVFVRQLADQDSVSARVTRRALATKDRDAEPTKGAPELVVIGSGNLGGVWFSEHRTRLSLSDLHALHPGLVEALAAHPGIGFVVVNTEDGPVAIGEAGVHHLATGVVDGVDPLSGFGRDTRADFLRAASFTNAPDIYVNSLYDPVLDEVAAFEELVGCHGGVGGWQTRPMLVYPKAWNLDPTITDDAGRLYGADAVHRQLVQWLRALGQRQGIDDE